ncbi:hypothetical protein I7860_16925 [Pseudomonas tolaasii]|uniref:hypothetical protein n=1 Tax=Pseudomonas tolaasii TaxID=29442 RepID=UPI001C5735EB|nr:hypothetical protein [Pseudomonas tolaasii]MBW1248370.1 hypothetical protein [Pseudomonas tolaasii]
MSKLSIGKRNEFLVWAKLIEEEFDVYPSLVDDKGIDGIVGSNGKYFEIQIKSGANWVNQRGFKKEVLEANPTRIYLVYNYTANQFRYFTAQQILQETFWANSISWRMSQINLNKSMLEKYKAHDWDGFISYLKAA